jgi:GTP cyclohydrolase I
MSRHPIRSIVDAADAGMPSVHRQIDHAKVERGVRLILEGIGENAEREGLRETPRRVAETYAELTAGMGVDAASVLEALPGERGEGLIMVRGIELQSVCEHHLLGFSGKAAVAYVPGLDGRICGISKLARVVDVLGRRLQVQERLVREVADALERALAPRGVFVFAEAEHSCMTMRGARARGTTVVTTEARGIFEHDPAARAELVALAREASA